MKQVEKKILPLYFNPVCMGKKNFELRKDEDDIQAGDTLLLKEWSEETGYTGFRTSKVVTYVLRNAPEYGLMDGYCIIGF